MIQPGQAKRIIDALAKAVAIGYCEQNLLAEFFNTIDPKGTVNLPPLSAKTGHQRFRVRGPGFAMSKGRRGGLAGAKFKRMPWIAANGILVLIPSALFLASKARVAEFDTSFYAVQALELVAGGANITLLGLNMRDGLKMKGHFRRRPA